MVQLLTRAVLVSFVLSVLVSLAGCNKLPIKPGPRLRISITANGTPIPRGAINLRPTDGNGFIAPGESAGGEIKNGVCDIRGIPVGKFLVATYFAGDDQYEQPKDLVEVTSPTDSLPDRTIDLKRKRR
jgi:hypothetical protein